MMNIGQWIIHMDTIHHINLAGVDLNLLVVFDALITERHVTKAGKKVGLSQPATSNALGRLRNLFDDELFVRTPEGMQPTPRATALAHPIGQVLRQIQSTLAQEPTFNPQVSERLFSVAMSDYGAFVVLPKLMNQLGNVAPKIKVRVRSAARKRAVEMLNNDYNDLVVGVFPEKYSWHQEQFLFKERFVGVCCPQHPLMSKTVTLETYIGASHLLVAPNEEDFSGTIDTILAQHNLQRNVVMAVPYFFMAPFVIQHTMLVGTLPERMIKPLAQPLGLSLFPLPKPLDKQGFSMSMLWHSRNSGELSHRWLRDTIFNLCQEDC